MKVIFLPNLFCGLNARLTALCAIAFLLVFGLPEVAFAQAYSLGDVMCNVSTNLYPPGDPALSLGNLINGFAYIAGAIFIGSGLAGYVRYGSNPSGDIKLHGVTMQVVSGAILLAFPPFTSWLLNSLALMPQGGGITTCGVIESTAASSGIPLDVLLTNLVLNIKDPMVFFLSVIAYTMGTFFMVNGFIKGYKYGFDPRANSVSKIAANVVIGAVLIVSGQSLGMMLNTVFGEYGVQASSIMYSWAIFSELNASAEFETAVYAALTFIQLIGMIAFVRGWLILKASVEGTGQATAAQGMTHIVGGVLAINIYAFLQIMDNTFGTGFLS